MPDEQKIIQRSVFREWIEQSDRQTTTTPAEVLDDYGVPRYLVMQKIEMQMEQSASCQALPFTLMLVISYAAVAISHMNAPLVRAVEHSISFDVEDNANFAYDSDFAGHKDLHEVNSVVDFWSFMSVGLVPLLWVQEKSWSEDATFRNGSIEPGLTPTVYLDQKDWGLMIYYNRIVGGIRLRQERAHSVTCDKSPELNPFYRTECMGGTLQDYSLDPDIDKARSMNADETVTKWMWVHQEYDDVAEMVKQMELTGWIDHNTEKVEISIPVYNAEYSVHSLININLYFSRGGHIWKHIVAQSIYANWFSSWYQFCFDATYLGCISWIFLTEIADVAGTFLSGGFKGLYYDYLTIWNFVDWVSIVFGFILMGFFFWCTDMSTKLNSDGVKIGAIPKPIAHSTESIPEVMTYIQELEVGVNWVTFTQKWLARYPLVIVFRLFKSFHAQPRLALVTMTLQSSMDDLFHFLIVFFSVMLGFVTSAVVLFGREVEDLVTFSRGCIYAVRAILGDLDFDALKVGGRVQAGAWMMVFMIFGSLLLLNMLLAIVMDAYSDVKANSSGSQTLWGQIRLSIKNMDGMHVPLKTVHKAVSNDLPEEMKRMQAKRKLKASAKKAKQEMDIDDGEESSDDEDDGYEEMVGNWQRTLLKVEHLKEVVANPQGDHVVSKKKNVDHEAMGKKKKKAWLMSDAQAREILIDTIMDYYDENQESADNFQFISSAEKIDGRLNLTINLHKRFNLRENSLEAIDSKPAEDDDDSSAEGSAGDEEKKDPDEIGHEEWAGEEEVEPYKPAVAKSKAPVAGETFNVKELMADVHDEFLKFLDDAHADRSLSVKEIARLNIEVQALRDRLSETGVSGSALNMDFLQENLLARSKPADRQSRQISAGSGPGSQASSVSGSDSGRAAGRESRAGRASATGRDSKAGRASALTGARLSRLDEEPIADSGSAADDLHSVPESSLGPSAPQPSALNLTTNRASAGMTFTDRAQAAAATPAPDPSSRNRVTAERLATLERKPAPKGPSLAYITLMKRQGMLPADYAAPDDQGFGPGGMADDVISIPDSAESTGGAQPSREVPHDSAMSEDSFFAGGATGLSDFDEKDLEGFSDEGSQNSDDDRGDAPVGVPFRVHSARVNDGVGLSGAGNNESNEQQPPSHDFEFTSFRDAQSQLRGMLSKHRPPAVVSVPIAHV